MCVNERDRERETELEILVSPRSLEEGQAGSPHPTDATVLRLFIKCHLSCEPKNDKEPDNKVL